MSMKTKKEFERVVPQTVGISVKAIMKLLDQLEGEYTEIHSIMVMRHDKIALEGWWAPYSPDIKHMMMSASKTFSGTAIGIACHEGILSLEDRLVDLLPQYIPDPCPENLKKVTVRDLMTMSSGSDREVPVDESWPQNYFEQTNFAYEPGTSFLYNNAPATLLAKILAEKTGQSLPGFLKEKLFEKIGIDPENITWFTAPDGTSFASGGLHCKSEDLLRLMRLYLHHGKWDGEEILSEQFVDFATSPQVDSSNIFGSAKLDLFSDNVFGYGGMMWISHDDLGYRAEGAYGQFGIVVPKLDLIIAITQSSTESPVSQTTLDQVWEFVETIKDEPVQEEETMIRALNDRLARLCVKKQPKGCADPIDIPCHEFMTEGKGVTPAVLFYDPIRLRTEAQNRKGMTSFRFEKKNGLLTLDALINGHRYPIPVFTNGLYVPMELDEMIYTKDVLVSGYWSTTNELTVRFRWIETGFTKELRFLFEENECIVSEQMVTGDDPDLKTKIVYQEEK